MQLFCRFSLNITIRHKDLRFSSLLQSHDNSSNKILSLIVVACSIFFVVFLTILFMSPHNFSYNFEQATAITSMGPHFDNNYCSRLASFVLGITYTVKFYCPLLNLNNFIRMCFKF